MRGVVDEAPARASAAATASPRDVAGKTGTTQDNTDGWFILMHPQLVAGAWVGLQRQPRDDGRATGARARAARCRWWATSSSARCVRGWWIAASNSRPTRKPGWFAEHARSACAAGSRTSSRSRRRSRRRRLCRAARRVVRRLRYAGRAVSSRAVGVGCFGGGAANLAATADVAGAQGSAPVAASGAVWTVKRAAAVSRPCTGADAHAGRCHTGPRMPAVRLTRCRGNAERAARLAVSGVVWPALAVDRVGAFRRARLAQLVRRFSIDAAEFVRRFRQRDKTRGLTFRRRGCAGCAVFFPKARLNSRAGCSRMRLSDASLPEARMRAPRFPTDAAVHAIRVAAAPAPTTSPPRLRCATSGSEKPAARFERSDRDAAIARPRLQPDRRPTDTADRRRSRRCCP